MAGVFFVMRHGRVNSELVSETLRKLGRIEHQGTHEFRFALLEECLRSLSVRTRDAALMGFALMEDPLAIPVLEDAAQDENVDSLRADILQVIADLQALQ